MNPSDTVAYIERAIPVVFKALKGHLHVPFWMKLGFGHDFFWLRDIKTMHELGATAVHQYSDFRITYLDIEEAKPPLAVPFGYGRWLRGPGCYATYLSAYQTNLQVMSSGGIWTWKDAVERMMCGATIAALESPVQYRGYKIFREIIEGITQFMERKGYKNPSEMVGLALPHINNQEEFVSRFLSTALPPESFQTILNKEKCNGCGLCSSCIYGAVTMIDKRPHIDLKICERCGACITICPVEALSIVASA
jgi:dihydropyrimidine dehydrogenase (NAD+) subunit PreA